MNLDIDRDDLPMIINRHKIEVVRIECEDTNGVSRGFNLDADYFLQRLDEGIEIPKAIFAFKVNGCEMFEGTGLLAECGYSNCKMVPQIKTFRVLPWKPHVASILSEVRFINGGKVMPQSPRALCGLQLEKLKKLHGLQLFGAYEFEFYLLSRDKKEPVTTDENVFSTLAQSHHDEFVREVMRSMKAIGIRPELHHRECGQAQHEITHSASFHLDCPDNAFRFKHLVKEIALKHDLFATFLSKPFADQMGSSGHYNHSLWNMEGKCVMHDRKYERKYGFTETAENWLAGLIHHSATLMAFATTTDNCYQRIQLNGFNPINDSWGFDNRSVGFRIKNRDTKKLYFENRLAGASVNPYLFTAACIIAGMDGIRRKLPLDVEPIGVDVETMEKVPDEINTLPNTMEQGLKSLEENKLFVDELGPDFMKCFVTSRRAEINFVNKLEPTNDMFAWYRDNYAEFL